MTGLTKFFKSLVMINPIIVKEIRSRMRGPRAFITLTLILLLLGGMMYGVLQILLANSRYSNMLSPQVGQSLFAVLAFMELFMICAVTPAVTAGAISGEKEKQTYEMLMATPLSPTSILWGKMISALSYVFILLFAAIPLASIVFIFGGVTPSAMLRTLLVLLGIAVAFGILGMFMSALFGRTGRATVASFVSVVLLMVGPLFLAGLIGVLRGKEPPRWILAPSPISALSAALASTIGPNAGGDIFNVLGGIFNMGVTQVSQVSIPRPLYHYSIPFYIVLSVVLYMLSARLVQPARRFRLRPREWAVGVGLVAVICGVIATGYYITAPRYEWAAPGSVNTAQGMAMPVQPVPMGIAEKQVVVAYPVVTATPAQPPATATPAQPPVNAYPAGKGTMAEPPSVLEEDTQAGIYEAVARRLLGADNTFEGNSPGWQSLYIISSTNDGVGDPNAVKGEAVKFSDPLKVNLTKRLNDLKLNITWIETNKDAPTDPKTGEIEGGKGVILTLGNVHQQPDGTLHVSASIYFANLGAAGKTYVLTKVNGAWTITGTTGVEWIS